MQDYENNTPGTSENGSGESQQTNENGCTYHSGPLPRQEDSGGQQSESPYGNAQTQAKPNEPPAGEAQTAQPRPEYPYGNAQNNTEPSAQDNGYSRPYHANQYPNGQQNRQYTTNGQPPIGNPSYPYHGGANENAAPPAQSKNKGAIALVVLLCVIAVAAVVGIVGALTDSNSGKNRPAVAVPTNDALTTRDNGPSLHIVSDPAADATVNGSQETVPLGELSSQQVYKTIRESSVGVLVYSKKTRQLSSEGSGVIIGEDSEGKHTYIVTCAHVINSSDATYKVMLFDESTHAATVIGYDSRTDIGVLRIDATGLKSADFGDVKNIEVGQTVYAIGNPGGSEFAGSFTNGMISAIARPVASQTGYTTKCIQHTAAINPGNSGGALVNAKGQVIGINSMKIVETEFEGMGFAVPADVVNGVVNDLITYGYIPDRAKLGITYVPASAYETYSIVVSVKGLPKGSVIIKSVSPDSDLANTEVQDGDMVVAVNGKNLDNSDVLASLVENGAVGDVLNLSMVRVNDDYSLREFTVRVRLVADLGAATPTPSNNTAENDLP